MYAVDRVWQLPHSLCYHFIQSVHKIPKRKMHCLSMENNPLSVAYGNNDRILNTLEKARHNHLHYSRSTFLDEWPYSIAQ